jgi:hypothetical protein
MQLLHGVKPQLLSGCSLIAGLEDVTLGNLEDLQRASKGGMDPNGLGASRLASDALWSDPVLDSGFRPNDARGVGMCFGPDVTEVGMRPSLPDMVTVAGSLALVLDALTVLWLSGGCAGLFLVFFCPVLTNSSATSFRVHCMLDCVPCSLHCAALPD